MPETDDKVRLFGALVIKSLLYLNAPDEMQNLLTDVRDAVDDDSDLDSRQYALWEELGCPNFTLEDYPGYDTVS